MTLHVTFSQIVRKSFFIFSLLFLINSPLEAQFNNYRAFMEIGGNCDIDNDTYNDFSFNLTNYSTNPTFNIVEVRINLSTAIMQDIFFDPNAQSGDKVGKGFTPNGGATPTGLTGSLFSNYDNFHSGYRELILSFADTGSNVFGQFNTLSFSLDVDHSSLKFYDGPDNVGRISGLDLVGATVTVEFSDGTILTSQATPVKNCKGKSELIFSDQCAFIGVPTLVSITTPSPQSYSFDTTHVIRLLGQPNKEVIFYQVEGEMDFKEDDHLPYPFDIDDHEENHFLSVKVDTVSLGNFGLVDIPVTLSNTAANGGRVHFFAVTVGDSSGFSQGGLERFCKSTVSNVVVIHYYEGICVNCNGNNEEAENGDIFQFDHYLSGAGVPNDDYTLFEGIAGTNDDIIFKSQWEGPLNYDIPMPNNDYEVYCLFSENEYGVIFAPQPFSSGGAGDRKFKITLEGSTFDNNLDIFTTAGGASTALYRRYVVSVTDNKLDFNVGASFAPGVDAPVMSGFCIKPLVLSVFPVEFSAFHAVQEGSVVNLDWSTASELNNDRFEVERSTEGNNFTVLASVNGKGTTDRFNSYQAQDTRPQVGLNYYRIRQVDIDGGVSYSSTLAINIQPFTRITVYPNPSLNKQVQLKLDGFEVDERLTVRVFSPLGQLLQQESNTIGKSGKLDKRLDLTHLAAGMYTISVTSGTGLGSSAVIMLK